MTESERAQFDRDGFLIVREALVEDALITVQHAAERAEARWRSDTNLPGARTPALEQVQAPIEYDDALLELLWHPALFPMVRAVLGDDISMIDNDLFLTPPQTPWSHASWHHDVGMPGVYHPKSLLMVKVFYLLTDVHPGSGGTMLVPGSHSLESAPEDLRTAIQITGKAGDAYLFNGRIYHCATNNDSDSWRKVLIYNYCHFWMKIWSGYEPSARLVEAARASGNPIRCQLLGIGDAYQQRLA
jgi:hypothetical protein